MVASRCSLIFATRHKDLVVIFYERIYKRVGALTIHLGTIDRAFVVPCKYNYNDGPVPRVLSNGH